MTIATLEKLDEAQEQTDIARKQLEEVLETYITARTAHLDALRVHNETD